MDSPQREAARPTPLYPPLQPDASGQLEVGGGHSLYWETCGNPRGAPAVFLHGGPGGGCYADHRRLFDPAHYRIVLFDQRGSGRSQPVGCLDANTTDDLIADMEALRQHLDIPSWLALGGSWGATLALLYAQRHRDRVDGLILRGVFTARRCEVEWLYKHGASALFPEAWEKFTTFVPAAERDDLVAAYHRRLTQGERATQIEAARAWCEWEGSLMTLTRQGAYNAGHGDTTLALARIEAHYFVNNCFLHEAEILANANKLAGLPGIIVQGRYDVVTPPTTAYALHRAWPDSRLVIVPDAGHATSEPGTLRALVEATDACRQPRPAGGSADVCATGA